MPRKSKPSSATKALSLDSVTNFFRQAGIDPEKPLGNATIDFRKINKNKFIRWLVGDALLVSEGADFPSNPGSVLTQINEILDDLLIDFEGTSPEHWAKHRGRFTQSVSIAYRQRCEQILKVQDGQSKRAYQPERIPLVVRQYIFAAVLWFLGKKKDVRDQQGGNAHIEGLFLDEGFSMDSFLVHTAEELPEILQTDPDRGASDFEGFDEAVVCFVRWLTGRASLTQTEIAAFMLSLQDRADVQANALQEWVEESNDASLEAPLEPEALLEVSRKERLWYHNRCHELYPGGNMPLRLRYWVFAAAALEVPSKRKKASKREDVSESVKDIEDANPFENTYLVTSFRNGVILNVSVVMAANIDESCTIVSAFFGEAQDIQHLSTALTVSTHNPVQFARNLSLQKKG